jgi:hypothetical protein
MMKRAFIAVVGVCLVASMAAAQEASPLDLIAAPAAPQPAALLANRVLKKTYLNGGTDLVAVPAGFQPIDNGVVVNCPGTAGVCALEVEQHLQVRTQFIGNRWAICTQVDGNWMTNPTCPYQTPLPGVNVFDTRSFTQTQGGLSFGNHVVRTFVYSDFGIDRSIFQLTYRIYKP